MFVSSDPFIVAISPHILAQRSAETTAHLSSGHSETLCPAEFRNMWFFIFGGDDSHVHQCTSCTLCWSNLAMEYPSSLGYRSSKWISHCQLGFWEGKQPCLWLKSWFFRVKNHLFSLLQSKLLMSKSQFSSLKYWTAPFFDWIIAIISYNMLLNPPFSVLKKHDFCIFHRAKLDRPIGLRGAGSTSFSASK